MSYGAGIPHGCIAISAPDLTVDVDLVRLLDIHYCGLPPHEYRSGRREPRVWPPPPTLLPSCHEHLVLQNLKGNEDDEALIWSGWIPAQFEPDKLRK